MISLVYKLILSENWYNKERKYRERMTSFTLLRMLQYGVPVNNIHAVIAVRTFEEEVGKYYDLSNDYTPKFSIKDNDVKNAEQITSDNAVNVVQQIVSSNDIKILRQDPYYR